MTTPNYLGQAGQLAVMSEFLARGYNVAAPEVDIGDDLFVIHDAREHFWKIQVKTATAERRNYGWSAQFLIPLDQLMINTAIELYYVLALRCQEQWEYVVIPRKALRMEYTSYGLGSLVDNSLRLYLAYEPHRILCSQRDLQAYRSNWSPWPNLLL